MGRGAWTNEMAVSQYRASSTQDIYTLNLSKIMKFIYVWIAEETGKGSEFYVLHAETFQNRDK